MTHLLRSACMVLVALLMVVPARGGDEKAAALSADLAQVDAVVIPPDSELGKRLPRMLAEDVRGRMRAANRRETQAWRQIDTRAAWEKYRDERIGSLRASLGQYPEPPTDLKAEVTGRIEGDGYRIENVVFESRPGLLVTANVYVSARPPASMPGIIVVHSHHNPKTQSELQDMGILWARLGCTVIVPDALGHGERRQHPFVTAADYAGTFRPSRQDYYFRYNSNAQLSLIGDGLVGWMAWDLMRCVDLLLSRPGMDREKIILLGAVAGGGDPAAVTAAIDSRIAAAAPFNFGGPQPETTFPLSPDAEDNFNYAGGGSWESTRNLRLSARDGFLPWVIVGSLAPRRLIYGHEFAWDREHDPVWARLQRIYGYYDSRDNLSAVHGRGKVTGQAPEATHCNNIGAVHRKQFYPTLKRWFGIAEPEAENQRHYTSSELACLTPTIVAARKAKPLHELAAELATDRVAAAQRALVGKSPQERLRKLREDWAKLLGDVESTDAKTQSRDEGRSGSVAVSRIVLEPEPGIVVPLLLLTPAERAAERLPVVVAFAQQGKQEMLRRRADEIAALLRGGAAVCLPDLRGTGETRPSGDARGRTSASTSLSSSELMLGQTLLGTRLRDLRTVLRYLRGRADLDSTRLALWGDSFAPANPPERNLRVPLDAEALPAQAEPLGALLALFGALYEDDLRAVFARGGLVSYQSALQSPFCYLPHDVVIPGALTAGDLPVVRAALASRPVRLEGQVDGLNRLVAGEANADAAAVLLPALRGK